MVSAEHGEILQIDRLEVDVLRWHTLEVPIGALADRQACIRAAGHGLAQLLGDAPAHMPLAVRVLFTGCAPAHTALIQDEEHLRQEVIGQAVSLDADRLWIEKVRIASEAPDTERLTSQDEVQGALFDLAELALAAPHDADFTQSVQADWMALLDKLPHEVLQVSPELQALKQDPGACLADRLRQATPLVLARIAPKISP
jgi:hypothetical protein